MTRRTFPPRRLLPVLAGAALTAALVAPSAHAGWSTPARVSAPSKHWPGWAHLASDDRGDAVVLATAELEHPETNVLEASTRSRAEGWSQPIVLAAGRSATGPADEEVAMSPSGEATAVWFEQTPLPHHRVLTRLKVRVHRPVTGWERTATLASWRTREELSPGDVGIAAEGPRGLVVAYSQRTRANASLQTVFLRRRDQRGRWQRPRAVAGGVEGYEMAVDNRGEVTLALTTEFGEAVEALVLSRDGAVVAPRRVVSLRGQIRSETHLAGNEAGLDTIAWQPASGEEAGCPGPVYAVTRQPGGTWSRPAKVAANVCVQGVFVATSGEITIPLVAYPPGHMGLPLGGHPLAPEFASRSAGSAWALTSNPFSDATDASWASNAKGELAAAQSRQTGAERKAGRSPTIEVITDSGGAGWRALPPLYPAGDMAVVDLAGDGTVTVAWREFAPPEKETSPSWTEVATYTP